MGGFEFFYSLNAALTGLRRRLQLRRRISWTLILHPLPRAVRGGRRGEVGSREDVASVFVDYAPACGFLVVERREAIMVRGAQLGSDPCAPHVLDEHGAALSHDCDLVVASIGEVDRVRKLVHQDARLVRIRGFGCIGWYVHGCVGRLVSSLLLRPLVVRFCMRAGAGSVRVPCRAVIGHGTKMDRGRGILRGYVELA